MNTGYADFPGQLWAAHGRLASLKLSMYPCPVQDPQAVCGINMVMLLCKALGKKSFLLLLWLWFWQQSLAYGCIVLLSGCLIIFSKSVSVCVCTPVSAYSSLSYQEDNYKISILPLCRWTLSYFDHICQDFIFKAFVSVGGYSVSPQRAMNWGHSSREYGIRGWGWWDLESVAESPH